MSKLPYAKPEPRALGKHRKRADADAKLEAAYEEVDLRDGPYCRATGRYTMPGAPDPRVRREHEHHENRSTHPERIADSTNIYVVCAEVHQLIHAGAIHVEGEPAGTLRFHWNREIVPAGKEPFRFKSRRWSQQDQD